VKQFLNKVTLTGADLSVRPCELASISYEFPFVEWGILVSRRKNGHSRYPTLQWIQELNNYSQSLNLSCHLCGEWAKDFAIGGSLFESEIGDILSSFNRVQLNISDILNDLNPIDLINTIRKSKHKFIIQIAEIPNNFKQHKWNNIEFLFDRSGGKGKSPTYWPEPYGNCGYAGGLKLNNLIEHLENISSIVGDKICWVDAESGIRSDYDQSFDLNKAKEFLNMAKPYVCV